MDKKAGWDKFIQGKISILEIVAIIAGVPTMIIFIVNIWEALPTENRIIVTVCAVVMLIAIGLFIRGRTRKNLLDIPPLLNKMRLRTSDIAESSVIDSDFALNSLISLSENNPFPMESIDGTPLFIQNPIAMDAGTLAPIDGINEVFKRVARFLPSKFKLEIRQNADHPNETTQLFNKLFGLEIILAQDRDYCKLSQTLNNLRHIVPTEQIAFAIDEYVRDFKISSIAPHTLNSVSNSTHLISTEYLLDSIISPTKSDRELSKSLAKVREAIDAYYKGN